MSLILQMSLKHFPRDQNFQDLPSLDIGFGKVVARSSSNSEAPKVDSSGASIPETKDDAALVLLTSEELTQLNAIKELARVGLQARDRLNDRKRFLSIIQETNSNQNRSEFVNLDGVHFRCYQKITGLKWGACSRWLFARGRRE